MRDGLVTLDPQGSPMEWNDAAEPWRKLVRNNDSLIRRVVQAGRQGKVELPVELGIAGCEVWLCKNGRTSYALFFPAVAPVNAPPANSAQVPAAPPVQPPRFVQMFANEPVALEDLIEDCVGRLSETTSGQSAKFKIASDTKARVYCDRRWLSHAVTLLLQEVAIGVPVGATACVKARQMGDYAVVSCQVIMQDSAAAANPAGGQGKVASTTALDSEAKARLSPCYPIIEMHGGKLYVEPFLPDGEDCVPHGIASFTLHLITGAPPMEGHPDRLCSVCSHYAQMEAYALDLTELYERP